MGTNGNPFFKEPEPNGVSFQSPFHPLADLTLNIFLFPQSPQSFRNTFRCILASSSQCMHTDRLTETSDPILYKCLEREVSVQGHHQALPIPQYVSHSLPCTHQCRMQMQGILKQAANYECWTLNSGTYGKPRNRSQ